MADSSGGGSSNNDLSPSSDPQQDKGNKNEGKLVDPSVQNPVNSHSSLTEFPPYKSSLEKSQNQLRDCGPLELNSTQLRVVPQKSHPADWNDPVTSQFEELLSCNLHTIFQNAIKRIVEHGYSEDDVQKAISRKGLYYEGKDLVLNVVNDTLAILKSGKGIDGCRDYAFEDLQQLVKYTIVEMVNVLKEVKPLLSTLEAMWWLLMCDLNISQACAVEADLLSEFGCKEVLGQCFSESTLPHPRSEAPNSEPNLLNANEPNVPKSSLHDGQSNLPKTREFQGFPNLSNSRNNPATEGLAPERKSFVSVPGSSQKSVAATPEYVQTTSQTSLSEEKLKTSQKVRNKKENVAQQKSSPMERYHKTYGKAVFKSRNHANVGGLIMEKRMRNPSELPDAHMKGPALKTKAKAYVPLADGSHQVPSNTLSAVSVTDESSNLPLKGASSASAAANSKLTASAEEKPSSKPASSCSVFPEISDYCAGIPYDKSLGKYVPQDKKDELILKLVPWLQELQGELQSWTGWANEKVMQAARRLNKDKPELKALRQEKEEAEQIKKEKKISEENTMKRLSEMESALNNAAGQVERANSNFCRVQVENCMLKKKMEAAKCYAAESAASCLAALEREQKALKDVQSQERQKGLLLEEIETQKQKVAELERKLGQERDLQNQIEARWKQERMAKEKLLAQSASIRKEREQLEAAAKAKEDMIKQKAVHDMKRHMEDMKKLENELSVLKFESDALRLAALTRGIDGNYGITNSKGANLGMKGYQEPNACKVANEGGNAWTGGLMRDRECAMCLSEEMSVVFLPCAHQVLCPNCNEIHEKQGMKDCPSCRTPIQRRIPARFAYS